MKNYIIINKTLVIVILFLFLGVTIAPAISGINLIKNIDKIEVQDNSQENTSLTFYTFDKTKSKERCIDLSDDVVEEIMDVIEVLKYKIVNDPLSKETESLKSEFIDILDIHGLLPVDMSKDEVLSLLNPFWLSWFDRGTGLMSKSSIFNRVNNVFNGLDFLKRFFLSPGIVDFLGENPRPGVAASSLFCSVASGGQGIPFPLFLLPRPRGFVVWGGREICGTNVGNLLSGRGFIAVGPQNGVALGFLGVGLTYSAFGSTYYAFIGYSTFVYVNAYIIDWFVPPNAKPVISNELPVDGAIDVPLSLPELSFRISDADGDRMDYSVTTSPNIGSGSGNFKKDGFYKVPVSGLKGNTEYTWRVAVNDEYNSVEKTFRFTTERIAPVVSDPLPFDGDDWVSIDTSELSFSLKDFQGDLMDYTVETSPDIGSGSGSGVGDGTYIVPVSGLVGSTEYSWFVNVTDGVHWTREVFVFKTQPIMVFDPFDEGWMYRKKITIDHDLVEADLSDFPVLVSVIDIDLRDKAQEDGDDILFMDGSGVATRLMHEIELFDDSDGELVCWVKLPDLDGDVDSVFYVYYGNPYCDSQEYPTKVWDEDYLAVWHMANNQDSTSNNYDLDIHGGMSTTNSYIGRGYDFTKSNGHYLSENNLLSNFESEVTYITWWYTSTVGHGDCIVRSENHHSADQCVLQISGTKLNALTEHAGTGSEYAQTTADVTINDWHFAALTYKSGSKTAVHYNGIKNLAPGPTGQIENGNDYDFHVGGERDGADWDGIIDEIQICKVRKSDDWINTAYNSMNMPSNFMSFGPEETA
jgi:hypothetical protein